MKNCCDIDIFLIYCTPLVLIISLSTLWTGIAVRSSLIQIDFYTTKLNPLQSPKKLELTIITFIEYRLLMVLNNSCANIIVGSVGMIKLQVLATTSQFYGVGLLLVRARTCLFPSPYVVLEVVLSHHRLYAAVLLHFINIVAILAVVLCIFISCFRTESICRLIQGSWSELDQTDPHP